MTRRTLLGTLAAAIATDAIADTQRKPVSPTAKQICTELLRLANRVQNAQLEKSDRDKLSETLAGISTTLQRKYNVPALCSTDAECESKFGR